MTGYLQQQKDGVCVFVKVQPRASRNEIAGVLGRELKIKVMAPPVDSAANQAVLRLLAEALGCPGHRLELIRGKTSPHKQILVRGMTAAEAETNLEKRMNG
jgi:uncharacterized protein (TIGR00251 family)